MAKNENESIANNPWYLKWDGSNSLEVITMIFKTKVDGMKYLLPLLGKPKIENEKEVYWDYDAGEDDYGDDDGAKGEGKLDHLFPRWDFGNGSPHTPTLLPVVFGKPLIVWDLG